jgi:hypothetical protein
MPGWETIMGLVLKRALHHGIDMTHEEKTRVIGGQALCGVDKNCPMSVPKDKRKRAHISVSP